MLCHPESATAKLNDSLCCWSTDTKSGRRLPACRNYTCRKVRISHAHTQASLVLCMCGLICSVQFKVHPACTNTLSAAGRSSLGKEPRVACAMSTEERSVSMNSNRLCAAGSRPAPGTVTHDRRGMCQVRHAPAVSPHHLCSSNHLESEGPANPQPRSTNHPHCCGHVAAPQHPHAPSSPCVSHVCVC